MWDQYEEGRRERVTDLQGSRETRVPREKEGNAELKKAQYASARRRDQNKTKKKGTLNGILMRRRW